MNTLLLIIDFYHIGTKSITCSNLDEKNAVSKSIFLRKISDFYVISIRILENRTEEKLFMLKLVANLLVINLY